jgi:hypothetical protein
MTQRSEVRGQRSEVRDQRSEVRDQKSEVRGQRSEVRGQKSEVGGQKSEVRGQRSEVRGQRSEVRDQRSEVRDQKSEVRGQKSEVGGQKSEVGNLQISKSPNLQIPNPLPSRLRPSGETAGRRGAILIIILVCFTLAAAMFVVLARLAATARNAAEQQHWSVQAQWLAEAGFERAAARLIGPPGYSGETWTIPPAQLSGRDGAVVKIRVEKIAGKTARRRVEVEASYPDDPVHRSRCTREIVLEERHEKQK